MGLEDRQAVLGDAAHRIGQGVGLDGGGVLLRQLVDRLLVDRQRRVARNLASALS